MSKKDFYDVNGKGDYISRVKEIRKQKVHDALEKGFKDLKETLQTKPKLRESLNFEQRNGFKISIQNTLDH